MIKIKNNTSLDRYDYPVDSKYRVKLDNLCSCTDIIIVCDEECVSIKKDNILDNLKNSITMVSGNKEEAFSIPTFELTSEAGNKMIIKLLLEKYGYDNNQLLIYFD